jgi:hypothetical protein
MIPGSSITTLQTKPKKKKKKKTAFKPSFAFESSTVYNDPSAQPKGTTSH